MKIEAGKYYRTRRGTVVGPMQATNSKTYWAWVCNGTRCTANGRYYNDNEESAADLISEVYISDTPPSDDVMLNLSEIARTKFKAMGEGNFGVDENPPCGIRLRWLVEVVDRPHDTLLNVPTPPADAPAAPPDSPKGSMLKPQDWRRLKPIEPAPEAKTLRDEFAMAALTGLLANSVDDGSMGAEDWASDAYLFADKMMEARKK